MLFADGDKSNASESILETLSSTSSTLASPNPIDLPPTSRLCKTLLQGGHFNHTTNTVERVPSTSWDTAVFGEQFVKVVGREATTGMCTGTGNGAFVVAELCEALIRGDCENGRRTLKGWFDDDVKKEVEDGEAKGKKLLLEKLTLL